MEALECIKTRRSVRKFTEEAVSREQMAEVVAAAAYAPSWKNTQTARYHFVTDKEKIARLASDCMMDFAYNQKTASHAPALVILTTITGRSGFERDGSFSTSKGTHWQSFDAGIAAEAFCLAAHAHGLGTVIMGVFEESDHRHRPSGRAAAGSRTQGRRYPAASDRVKFTSPERAQMQICALFASGRYLHHACRPQRRRLRPAPNGRALLCAADNAK